ncbi:MAG: hypothetical protein HZC28_07985 [Spirochaetes bacterium]|nr:hypothetical protein [Spirochaetota bacterium]
MKKTIITISLIACIVPLTFASLLLHKNKNETYKRDNPTDRKAVNWNSKITETNAGGMPAFTWSYEIVSAAGLRITVAGIDAGIAPNIACTVNREASAVDYVPFTSPLTVTESIPAGTNTLRLYVKFKNGFVQTNSTNFAISFIYLSVAGDDGNSGLLPDAPVRTFVRALDKAKTYGLAKICVAKGTYQKGNEIIGHPKGIFITNSGIDLSGGWENDFSARNTGTYSTLDGYEWDRVMTVQNASNVTIDGFEIINGFFSASGKGGGLYMENVTHSRITNCIFRNNRCEGGSGYGGALYATNLRNSSLTGIFYKNQGAYGGAVYIRALSNSIISGSYYSNSAMNWGGAICVENCNDAAMSVTCYDNTSSGSGGGILVYGITNSTITGTFLRNVTGGFSGGGLDLLNGYSNAISGYYAHNKAGFGGGISIQGHRNTVNATACSNSAEIQTMYRMGGGFYVAGNSNAISGTMFSNWAANGGGCYISGICNTLNVSLYNNSSLSNGGGIAAHGLTNGMLALNVFGNTARLGGGVFLSNCASNTASGTNRNNTASFSGGGIYGSQILSNAFSGSLYSNTSIEQGGGICVVHWNCSDNLISADIFHNSVRNYGGGIYAEGSSLEVTGQVFSNSASNGYGYGGGFALSSAGGPPGSATISGAVFGNFASNGGGVYSDINEKITCSLYGNTASNGAAVLLIENGMSGTSHTILSSFATNNTGMSIIHLTRYAGMGSLMNIHISNCTIGGTNGSSSYAIYENTSQLDISNQIYLTNRFITGSLGFLYHDADGDIGTGSIGTMNAVSILHDATNRNGNYTNW